MIDLEVLEKMLSNSNVVIDGSSDPGGFEIIL